MQITPNQATIVVTILVAIIGMQGIQMGWRKWRELQARREARADEQYAVFEELAEAVRTLNGTVLAGHESDRESMKRWMEEGLAAEERAAGREARLDTQIQAGQEIQTKALDGVMKACGAIAVATDKHRETVAAFGKLVFGKDEAKESLQIPTDVDRDRVYSETLYRGAGHTHEEAQALAQVDADRDAATYPAE